MVDWSPVEVTSHPRILLCIVVLRHFQLLEIQDVALLRFRPILLGSALDSLVEDYEDTKKGVGFTWRYVTGQGKRLLGVWANPTPGVPK
jgi:hypothetical protein